MPALIKLELNQVKEIIEQFTDEEKIELARFINKLAIEKINNINEWLNE